MYSYRCHLSSGTAFTPNAAWIRNNVEVPNVFYSILEINAAIGHADVNGDGFPDFCTSYGNINCFLGSVSGIASTPTYNLATLNLVAPSVTNIKEGAAFLDVNGDGNADFCRIVGPSPFRLACRLSNGRGWEANDRLSSNLDPGGDGHKFDRYWADINGDGLPDFCRAIGPDPRNNAEPDKNRFSNMHCRLTYGGDAVEGFFATTEVRFIEDAAGGIDFGVGNGGRGFCDIFGRGFQTFCRATLHEGAPIEYCFEGESGQVCQLTETFSHGVGVGFYGGKPKGVGSNDPRWDRVQASPHLVQSFTDSLGADTVVTYVPLSNEQVYAKSGAGTSFPRVILTTPRAPVVYETRAWRLNVDPTLNSTLTGTARYFYKDLRSDRDFGSRGFRERWHLTEGSNNIQYVKYFQGLGSSVDASSIANSHLELGVPIETRSYAIDPTVITVTLPSGGDTNERRVRLKKIMELATNGTSMTTAPVSPPTASQPFMLLKSTVNVLGQTTPTANPRYRPVVQTMSQAWDWNDRSVVVLPSVSTTSDVSYYGNVKSRNDVTTQGPLTWGKLITSEYLQDRPLNVGDDRTPWMLGRMTKSTVVATAPTADAQIAANSSSFGTSPNANVVSSSNPVAVVVTPPNYTSTAVGQNSTANATVYNNTGGSLVMVVPTSSSVTGADFTFVSTTCATLLSNGANCTIAIKFTPTVPGTRTGSVSVDTASGQRMAAITSQASSSASTATVTSAAPNLGTVWLGAAAPTATVSIRNDGNVPMTLSGLQNLSTRFQLTANSCASVGVGASCAMTLSMPTNATGNAANTVTTVGATNNATFAINGAVVSSVSTWSVTSLAFGTVGNGLSATQNLTLSNSGFGTVAANWSGALFNLPTGFTANTSACAAVMPGSSCNVAISFSPTVAQAYSGTGIRPSVVSTAANTLSVSGSGVVPIATLASSPTSINFGAVTSGNSGSAQVTISNSSAYAGTALNYSLVASDLSGGTISISSNSCASSLGGGSSCVIAFLFSTPGGCDQGSVASTLTITGSNLSAALAIQLNGLTTMPSGCGARGTPGSGK